MVKFGWNLGTVTGAGRRPGSARLLLCLLAAVGLGACDKTEAVR